MISRFYEHSRGCACCCLTVGREDQLGYNIRGTTDAALVLRQAAAIGLPAIGSRWLWKVMTKQPAIDVVADVAAAAEELSAEVTTSTASAQPA